MKKAILGALLLASPAFATCKLTNDSGQTASVFAPASSHDKQALDPGKSIDIPEGEFTVVLGKGAAGKTCTTGKSYSIVQDPKIDYAVVPRIDEK